LSRLVLVWIVAGTTSFEGALRKFVEKIEQISAAKQRGSSQIAKNN
jgi:hypothetical protein